MKYLKDIYFKLVLKRSFRNIYNFLLGLIFILALILVVSALHINGSRILTVKSGSMEPKIKTGSIIFVLPRNDYEVGDIVTFRTNDNLELVTHRIIEERNNEDETYYVTKGDANDIEDSVLLPHTAIKGKSLISIPLLGYLMDLVKKPLGLIILIIIPGTIIIYSEVQKIQREINNIRSKRKAILNK